MKTLNKEDIMGFDPYKKEDALSEAANQQEYGQNSSTVKNKVIEIIGKKCEWCGCPDGIHKTNCRFIIKMNFYA